jgi:hypothetical protein
MTARKTDFYDGKPGYAFKNGKFYRFDWREVMVVRGWPDPRAWLKRPSHDWKPTRKFADDWFSMCLYEKCQNPQPVIDDPLDVQAGQLLLPLPAWFLAARHEMSIQRNMLAQDAFFNTIPDVVRSELLPFPDRKWHLLNLFARCPGACELAHGNPALAYALASNWAFRKPAVRQPIRAARSLVRKKQKKILGWLGFPPSETVRRILSKIVPQSLSIERLLYLRDAIPNPAVQKTLAHLPRINAGVLRLAADPRYFPYITPRLLDDVGRNTHYDEPHSSPVGFLFDTLKMANQDEWRHCPKRFSSLNRLLEVHDELARRLRPLLEQRIQERPLEFPAPPFMGTRTIRPILSADELLREGDLMEHCVGSYADDVAVGQISVYRVLEPVRATLSLCRRQEGWKADQLTQSRNARVDSGLRQRLFQELLQSGPYRKGDLWDKNQIPFPFVAESPTDNRFESA